MEYKVGKKYHFYENGAMFDFCLAHVLSVLPHPEDDTDQLIVYRWHGVHKQWWFYRVTTAKEQEQMKDYVARQIERKRGIRKERKKPGTHFVPKPVY